MRLDLRFTNRPLNELWCQAVVMLSFKVHEKISPFLGPIDKKMSGSISQIIQSGAWSGECGEKLLFATQSAIKADKLLIHGLGDESRYSIDLLKREIENAGVTLIKMGVSEFGFRIPDTSSGKQEFDIHIETAVKGLTMIYLNKYMNTPDYILKIYISITNDYIKLVEKVVDRLRTYFSPLTDLTIIIDRGPGFQGSGVSEPAAS